MSNFQPFLNELKLLIANYDKDGPQPYRNITDDEIRKVVRDELGSISTRIDNEIKEYFENEVKSKINDKVKDLIKYTSNFDCAIKERIEDWIENSYEIEGLIKDHMRHQDIESFMDMEYILDQFLKYLKNKLS